MGGSLNRGTPSLAPEKASGAVRSAPKTHPPPKGWRKLTHGVPCRRCLCTQHTEVVRFEMDAKKLDEVVAQIEQIESKLSSIVA